MSVLLETERLILRPPRAADIGRFVPLMADYEVAKNLSRVPHPYTEDDASAYIVKAAAGWASGEDFGFSILRKFDSAYVGMCGVHPSRGGELGYWIGRPFWGKGFATEAVGRAVAFAFRELEVEGLRAAWFHDNPASGRVLRKLGFAREGMEDRPCLARGRSIPSHLVALDRATYITRKMAA